MVTDESNDEIGRRVVSSLMILLYCDCDAFYGEISHLFLEILGLLDVISLVYTSFKD